MLNYDIGQSFTLKDDIAMSEGYENLMMTRDTEATIVYAKEGVEFPYLVKFSNPYYEIAMKEEEIDIYFNIKS